MTPLRIRLIFFVSTNQAGMLALRKDHQTIDKNIPFSLFLSLMH